MKKFSLAALAVAVATLVPALLAAPAQAYPQAPSPHVHVQVQQKVVVGGTSFVVRAHADVRCDWTLSFRSEHASGSGTDFTHRFIAPNVHRQTSYPLAWDCAFSAGGSADRPALLGLITSAQTQHESGNLAVAVQPRGSGTGHGHGQGAALHTRGGDPSSSGGAGAGSTAHVEGGQPATGSGSAAAELGTSADHGPWSGLLPNTGGPAFWVLLAGLVLLVGGGVTMVLGRRRRPVG